MASEHTLRSKFAFCHFTDRDEFAPRGRVHFGGRQRRVPAAQDDRVAHPEPMRLIVAHRNMRQVGKRLAGIDQIIVEGGKSFRIVLDLLQRHEIGERDHVLLAEGGNEGATE